MFTRNIRIKQATNKRFHLRWPLLPGISVLGAWCFLLKLPLGSLRVAFHPIDANRIDQLLTGDSKWPFDPLVGGHQQPLKGSRFHLPKKGTSRIARYIVLSFFPPFLRSKQEDMAYFFWLVLSLVMSWALKMTIFLEHMPVFKVEVQEKSEGLVCHDLWSIKP